MTAQGRRCRAVPPAYTAEKGTVVASKGGEPPACIRLQRHPCHPGDRRLPRPFQNTSPGSVPGCCAGGDADLCDLCGRRAVNASVNAAADTIDGVERLGIGREHRERRHVRDDVGTAATRSTFLRQPWREDLERTHRANRPPQVRCASSPRGDRRRLGREATGWEQAVRPRSGANVAGRCVRERRPPRGRQQVHVRGHGARRRHPSGCRRGCLARDTLPPTPSVRPRGGRTLPDGLCDDDEETTASHDGSAAAEAVAPLSGGPPALARRARGSLELEAQRDLPREGTRHDALFRAHAVFMVRAGEEVA